MDLSILEKNYGQKHKNINLLIRILSILYFLIYYFRYKIYMI